MASLNVSELKSSNILILGNSISTEAYAPNAGWGRVMAEGLRGYCGPGSTLTVDWSMSISGQTTGQIMALPYWTKYQQGKKNIAIVFEGSNDLYYAGLGVPDRVEQCAARLNNLALLLTWGGWYTVVMTTSPRANGYGAAGTTNPAQYNADCLALDARIAQLAASAKNTTNEYQIFNFRQTIPNYTASMPWCPDGVHPASGGCASIGNNMAFYLHNKALGVA